MCLRAVLCIVGLIISLLGGVASRAFGRDEPKELEHTKDSLEEVKKRVEKEKAVLLDVRELSEWSDGHIKGAIHLALRSLEEKADEKELKEKFKDKIIYTYCMVGKRSLRAGQILHKFGLEVRPLKPGYEDLIKAGFENEK